MRDLVKATASNDALLEAANCLEMFWTPMI
jgi:hypothetical protein